MEISAPSLKRTIVLNCLTVLDFVPGCLNVFDVGWFVRAARRLLKVAWSTQMQTNAVLKVGHGRPLSKSCKHNFSGPGRFVEGLLKPT